MKKMKKNMCLFVLALILCVLPTVLCAGVTVQCPGDLDGDAIPDPFLPGGEPNPEFDPKVKCMHLGAGDGYITMADGLPMYIFSFVDLTGVAEGEAIDAGMLAANFPAPTIVLDEGDHFYLTLTNVGMMVRPDLFDPHTVHWHGFPNAASVFDGVPDASISINMLSSLTYYYKVVEPGTYMYHCHVEATEHMQMGMLGNLYVRPAQDRLPPGTDLNGFIHQSGYRYAYNDGDGSTFYDRDYAIQIGSFDPDFHQASESVQPLPFAAMKDKYPMLNGRGYPDTVNPAPLPPPPGDLNMGKHSQNLSSLIEAVQGERILLRISNLNVTRFYTLATAGIPMMVVGKDSRLLRSKGGENLYYKTNSVTLGGGESIDVILDTSEVAPGTYFLYTTNLNYLSNNQEDFGGMMTEIIVQ